MLDVAWAEVRRAPGRTVLRALAIGGAIAITLLFEGFRLGIDRQMGAVAGALPGPLIALEAGASHFVGVRSNLPQSARAAVESVPGVRTLHPLVSSAVIFKRGERRTPIQLVAYDSAGAPSKLTAGRSIGGPREIIFDERLARLYGIHAGDRIELLDKELTVVGLSANTDVYFTPFAFLTYDELIDLYLDSDVPGAMSGAHLLSFLLVEVQPGVDPAAVRRDIEARVPAVDVLTPAELAAEDVKLGRQLFGPVVNLLVGVSWVVVALAVALTMYAAVIDRRRDFGVMKALGVRTGGLASAVVLEALLIAVLALPAALVLARAGAAAIEGASPLYRVLPWDPVIVPRALLAAIVAGLAGALLPVRQVATVEPDLVFRS